MSFSIMGVRIEITFLFVAFISFLISLRAPANVLMTVISSLFHELGHLFVMLLLKDKPQKVRFELTGINIIRQSTPLNTVNEIFTALGGPAFNGILVALSCVVLCFRENEGVFLFACTNFILMVFNMLPVRRLDGGIVFSNLLLRFTSWENTVRITRAVSILFTALIYVWGFYSFYINRFNFSLIIIAIFLTLSLISDKEC